MFDTYTGSNIVFSTNMDPNASKQDLYNQESGWFDRTMVDMNLDNPFVLKYFSSGRSGGSSGLTSTDSVWILIRTMRRILWRSGVPR